MQGVNNTLALECADLAGHLIQQNVYNLFKIPLTASSQHPVQRAFFTWANSCASAVSMLWSIALKHSTALAHPTVRFRSNPSLTIWKICDAASGSYHKHLVTSLHNLITTSSVARGEAKMLGSSLLFELSPRAVIFVVQWILSEVVSLCNHRSFRRAFPPVTRLRHGSQRSFRGGPGLRRVPSTRHALPNYCTAVGGDPTQFEARYNSDGSGICPMGLSTVSTAGRVSIQPTSEDPRRRRGPCAAGLSRRTLLQCPAPQNVF